MSLKSRLARHVGSTLLLALTLLALLGPHSRRALGQIREGRAVPRDIYFLALEAYYGGNYRNAVNGFQSAARSGVRSTEGRWIDSICYYTMLGECFYRMGDLQSSLEQHELALRLTLAHRQWTQRLQWPPAVQVAQPMQIPWGPSARQTVPGQFPETVLSLQGTNIDRVVRQGGVLAPPELYPVRVMEIMRCIAVSLRRRHEILGPLAQYEPLSAELVQGLPRLRVSGNTWVNPLVEVQLGLAQLALGRNQEASDTLRRALTINGRMDHPLTAMALIELGKLSFLDNKLDVAARSFFEATFGAAQFAQPDVLEEAMSLAAQTHALMDGQEVYRPLSPAVSWCRTRRYQRAQASLLLAAAENATLLNQTQQAASLLAQANRAAGRTDLMRADFGPRWQFQSSVIDFQAGRIRNGQQALANSLKLRSSPRLFQIARTAALYKANEFSPRVAGQIYAEVLREPTDLDWILGPFETIHYCLTPQLDALNSWLEIALERNELDVVIHVSDMIRRQKFFAELPMGGRVLGLRWILNGPVELMNRSTQAQRQALWKKYPDVADLCQEIQRLQQAMRGLPPIIENKSQRRNYEQVVTRLDQISHQLDDRLMEIAVRPDPSDRMFPPLRTLDDIQESLEPGRGTLIFVVATNRTQAILLTGGNRYKSWELRAPARMRKLMSELMREIGNHDKNQALEAARLTDENWKRRAQEIYAPLSQELTPEVLETLEELTIVPDGFFWHLPFEMLQVPASPTPRALIEQTSTRYVPTASLAIKDPRPIPTGGDTAIAVGRLYGRESDAIIRDAGRRMLSAAPRGVPLRRPLPAESSLLSARWDRLIVLDDVDDMGKGVFDWTPAQIDRGAANSTVAGWMASPWSAPQQLVLPGFHTACENGLRGRVNGDEMLLATSGLMASGVRTILLSRWRTGGQLSMDLVREFVQELPQETASAAWQRSVLLARSSDLDPRLEPRLREVDAQQLPKAEQPFFWGGYLLIDTGSRPAQAAAGQ